MESAEPKEGASSLRDVIVTLPQRTFIALAVATLAALGGAVWIAAVVHADEIKSAAAHAVVVLLPVLIALIAAAGIRRTSTRQIDTLVDAFLHRTMLERFTLWCEGSVQTTHFPFDRVDKLSAPQGLSYAHFRFHWRDATHRAMPPADVAVKMNVFNFEVIADVELHVPAALATAEHLKHVSFDRHNLDDAAAHPLLRLFFGTLQGSIEEGYAARVSFGTPRPEAHGKVCVRMSFSLRQKQNANFLTSPFLKRYFAEDAAIVVGVIYRELLASGLAAPSAD